VADEITWNGRPPDDLMVRQGVGAGDSSVMRVVRKVGLSPLGGVVVTVTRVSAQLDFTIAKWGERNIIRVC